MAVKFDPKAVTASDRGFKQVFEMHDLYGTTVRVVESSLATQPAVWVFTENVNGVKGTAHLGFEHLDALVEALKWIKKNHYQVK